LLTDETWSCFVLSLYEIVANIVDLTDVVIEQVSDGHVVIDQLSDGDVVTSGSKLFYTRGPATTKARSPAVTQRVSGTSSADVDGERGIHSF